MAQTFWGAGGQFDVRGRDAVEKEARRERALLEARAEKSRLGLAEKAMQRRALGARGRTPLPSTSSVTLPWLFDQVTHGLEKRHAALGGGRDRSWYHGSSGSGDSDGCGRRRRSCGGRARCRGGRGGSSPSRSECSACSANKRLGRPDFR